MSSSSSSSSESGSVAGPSDSGSVAGPSLDGQWTGGFIEGDLLTWRDGQTEGNTTRLTRTSPTECSLTTKKGTYTGKLTVHGMLQWSDGDVWSRCLPDAPKLPEQIGVTRATLQGNPERRRLEREAIERVREKEKERAEEAKVYIGKPDMPASWAGGGWGGPKEGHDKDDRFMRRGEARELPDYAYRGWQERGRVKNLIEEKMANREIFDSAWVDPDLSSGEEGCKKKKKGAKKKEKEKKKKDKKLKKGKKDKDKKKGKKEKDKKTKKDGKKKRKSKEA